jgi:phage terminase small subunit
MKAPKHLSKQSRELWRKIVNAYDLSPEGESILEVALVNLDLAERARRELEHSIVTIDGRRHPATDVLKAAHSMYLRAMRQLGVDLSAVNNPGVGIS